MSAAAGNSLDEVIDIGKSMDCETFVPLPDEIFLDIDKPDANINDQERVLRCFAQNDIKLLKDLTTKSRRGNTHHYLKFNRTFTPIERLIVQTALGSDAKKEVLSLLRGEEMSFLSVLFETQAEAKRVTEWRVI